MKKVLVGLIEATIYALNGSGLKEKNPNLHLSARRHLVELRHILKGAKEEDFAK